MPVTRKPSVSEVKVTNVNVNHARKWRGHALCNSEISQQRNYFFRRRVSFGNLFDLDASQMDKKLIKLRMKFVEISEQENTLLLFLQEAIQRKE